MKLLSKKWIVLISISAIVMLAGCQKEVSEAEENHTKGNKNNTVDTEEIVGIDPGSGTMSIANKAVDGYDLDLQLTPSSEGAMLATLDEAIENKEPIIVTLWQPHWAFEKYDLKFLDDPEGHLGESEKIHTFVREGLKDEKASAYELLDNFKWKPEDMNEILSQTKDDVEASVAAKKWVEDNRDKVDAWTEGIEPVEDETVQLAYVNWSSANASTNVVKIALEELGYDVKLNMVDMGVAWQSLAVGDIDGMLMAWLPSGSAAYYKKYKDEIVNLGPNLEGAQQGFAVPEYMDIDSIEALPTK
ncbi:glycine/betaine ABC transporter [Lentibacillus cibarius]|uniref:Glycine/betaine ABC transporter n=1 Tax=Lentibacillus cibarius TaxID=2583219 RepID=A0A549YF97_9BACI|nr:glycine betaine ABC transporter substrate-binding protein [Lentibacillus cibarius]TRM10561.1 glycine/betaine ABC transporter [Lentibacillus cibarius]